MSLSTFWSRLSAACGVLGLAGASVSGCGGGGGGSVQPPPPGGLVNPGTTPFINTSRLAATSACTANPHQNGRARWTVLVYINAANNLQPDSLLNVSQMAAVGSGNGVNIVLQWKQAQTCTFFTNVKDCGTPSFVGTHRYFLQKHSQADVTAINNGNTSSLENATERLADPVTNTLKDNGNPTADMGDYNTLAEFVKFGATNYPADHLAVVVWDHGSGALNVLNRSAKRHESRGVRPASHVSRGVSQDANTGSEISTQQLALALSTSPQKVDDLFIDCSLQCTTEVAYEVRNSARLMVGSEESPPGTGYPYDTWLRHMEAGSLGPCDAGRTLIQDNLAVYADPSNINVTQAMIDLQQMGGVASALNAFGNTLASHAGNETDLLYNARFNAQYYDFAEYKDLYHFAYLVRTSPGVTNDLTAAALNLQNTMTGSTGAVLMSVHGAAGQANSSGLSIFLPGPNTSSNVDDSTGYDPAYDALALAKDAPGWPAFIKAQLK